MSWSPLATRGAGITQHSYGLFLCPKSRSTLRTESEDELQAQVFKDDIYMISSKNNKARVVESDIVGENVVIHIIDSILE